MFGQSRSRHQRRGILLDVVGASKPLKPTAYGSKRARSGSLGEAAVVECAEVGTDVRVFNTGDAEAAVVAGEPSGKVVQLTPVSSQRVNRRAALRGEDMQ